MKRPSGCSISQQRIGHGPTQSLSRKMSSLRCNAERPSAPHCCANLSSAVPVGMGVTLIICSPIHLDLLALLVGESHPIAECPPLTSRLELEFGRLQHWEVSGLRALKDLTGVDADLTKHVQSIGSVAH